MLNKYHYSDIKLDQSSIIDIAILPSMAIHYQIPDAASLEMIAETSR